MNDSNVFARDFHCELKETCTYSNSNNEHRIW